jgi:hypothetical protein
MRPIKFALAIAITLSVTACGLLSGGNLGPKVEQCGIDEGSAAVGDVTDVLLAGSGLTISDEQAAELEALGVKYTVATVECIARAFIDSVTAHNAQADTKHREAAARARDYLQRKAAEHDSGGHASVRGALHQSRDAAEPAYPWLELRRLFVCRVLERGFEPLAVAVLPRRPWHVVLAGARGVRS